MSLIHKIKELKNFRRNGVPSDGESAAWEKPYETLRKKWVEVPTTAAGSEKTTRLLELPDQALLAEWEKARLRGAGKEGDELEKAYSGQITAAEHGS